jgi:Ser/Thr protein kinase RdoA (MazF antagonist)
MQEYFDRINLNVDLSKISKEICKYYNLGNYLNNEIIKIGYEDFNYVLITNNGKWFVKILYKGRGDAEVNAYLDRLLAVNESEISSPKLLKVNNNFLYKLEFKNIIYKILVFEYIDGNNIFELGTILNEEEIKYLAKQIKLIHQIDIKPNFIYDSWAINNFLNEYDKKCSFIPLEFKNQINGLYNIYKGINFSKLSYAFVHGDIMNTNIMKDNNGKLWLVDFAVSNYLPRIQDLAVVACNICVVDDKEESYQRIKALIKEYTKEYPLTDYEKEIFKTLFDISNAMFLMQASYQKSIGNNSKETLFWLNKGVKGLRLSDENLFKQVLN